MRLRSLAAVAAAAVCATGLAVGPAAAHQSPPGHLVATWGAAMATSSTIPFGAAGPASLSGHTLREIVHTSVGGTGVRIRLSNVFGDGPVSFDDVTVAKTAEPTGADRFQHNGIVGDAAQLTFGGHHSVVLQPGQLLFSDVVPLNTADGADLSVSLHVVQAPAKVTYHLGAFEQNYASADAADHAHDAAGTSYTVHNSSWEWLDELDVRSATAVGTIVVLGDSITDGANSSYGENKRWPDDLAVELHGLKRQYGVVNSGIVGDQLTADSTWGPSGVSRLDRDVLSRTGVRMVIILLGVNDVRSGRKLTAADFASAYQGIEHRAALISRHIRVVGETILPFLGGNAHAPASEEQLREDVNAWITKPGSFPLSVDLAAALTAPGSNPPAMDDQYDACAPSSSGVVQGNCDHLHPNDAGHQYMADVTFHRLRHFLAVHKW